MFAERHGQPCQAEEQEEESCLDAQVVPLVTAACMIRYRVELQHLQIRHTPHQCQISAMTVSIPRHFPALYHMRTSREGAHTLAHFLELTSPQPIPAQSHAQVSCRPAGHSPLTCAAILLNAVLKTTLGFELRTNIATQALAHFTSECISAVAAIPTKIPSHNTCANVVQMRAPLSQSEMTGMATTNEACPL